MTPAPLLGVTMADIVIRLRETVTMLAVTPMNLSLQDWDRHANNIQDAAAEITRLRAGGCARDQGTTQYCAEAARLAKKVSKLEAECFSLSAWACVHFDGKTGLVQDEHGNSYCAKDAHIKQLRAALEQIAEMTKPEVRTGAKARPYAEQNIHFIARAALGGDNG